MPDRVLSAVLPWQRGAFLSLYDAYAAEGVGLGLGPARRSKYLPLYGREPGRHAWFIQSATGEPAGLVLVRRRADGRAEMAEFFVQPRHRRQGLGAAAATAALQRVPGPWSLAVAPENPLGRAFWPKVVDAISQGAFDARVDGDGWTEYRFTTSGVGNQGGELRDGRPFGRALVRSV